MGHCSPSKKRETAILVFRMIFCPFWPNLSRLWAILERWFSLFFRWDLFGDPLAPHLRNPDEAKTGIERDWWNRYWTWKVIFRPCERWISCLFFWLLCSTPTWLNFYYVQEPEPTCILLFRGQVPACFQAWLLVNSLSFQSKVWSNTPRTFSLAASQLCKWRGWVVGNWYQKMQNERVDE